MGTVYTFLVGMTLGKVAGRHIVAQKRYHLAVNCSKRRIRLNLVLTSFCIAAFTEETANAFCGQ